MGSGAKVLLCVSPSQLNLSRPIEEQGPLDVIIHKLTDVILEADQNDSQSLELVHRFQVSGDERRGAANGSCVSKAAWLCVCSQSGSALAKTWLVVRHFLARASMWLGVKWD